MGKNTLMWYASVYCHCCLTYFFLKISYWFVAKLCLNDDFSFAVTNSGVMRLCRNMIYSSSELMPMAKLLRLDKMLLVG